MEAPNVSTILTRVAMALVVLIAFLFGMSIYKKKQRQNTIVNELKSIASDSSFFQQFYAEQAEKTLIRAVGLLAEADKLGVPPDKVIDRCLGVVEKGTFDDTKNEEPSPRETLVRECLRGNYENFRKLGYQPDFQTLASARDGKLPVIPSGPSAGKAAVIATLIPESASPGIEKVLANLQIRPPTEKGQTLNDLEVTAAKHLAYELAEAKVIDDGIRDKIVEHLTGEKKP
jgi:hypothetical protein